MDPAPAVGAPVRTAARVAVAFMLAGGAAPAAAEDHYALVITGAPGGDQFRAAYEAWERRVSDALVEHLGFTREHVELLSGVGGDPERTSTREHVQRVIQRLRSRVGPEDLLLVVMMGHGTVDGGSAKFNLVGPDLTSVEWGQLLRDMPGRIVFVDTTGASHPFMADLAAHGRVVVTATDSAAQRYDTAFAPPFAAALTDPAADLDKNGRVSVWELFVYTSRTVARHYEQQGLLATERAVLDDSGDGAGVEAAEASAADGALARATYLERDPVEATADAALAALLTRRRELEEAAEALRQKKPTMAPEQWEREFETLMIELARVSHRIRAGS
jgi:hypothetical protein